MWMCYLQIVIYLFFICLFKFAFPLHSTVPMSGMTRMNEMTGITGMTGVTGMTGMTRDDWNDKG